MSETVQASDGTMLPINDLPQTITYSGSLITSIAVTYPNNQGVTKTYVQTFTYTGTNVTEISQFEPQP